MEYNKYNCIVWMDMELTGLDVKRDTIIEVACLITDQNLNIVSREFNVGIIQSDTILENTNESSTNSHAKDIQECKQSKIHLKEVDQMLLNFLKEYIPKQKCPTAGTAIYRNRLFLEKFMPLVCDYLYYRIIDVNTVKELARRWNSKVYENRPEKQCWHGMIFDIKESIKELRYYKENIFIPPIV